MKDLKNKKDMNNLEEKSDIEARNILEEQISAKEQKICEEPKDKLQQDISGKTKLQKTVLRALFSLLGVLAILFLLQRIFVPKYTGDVTEGRLIAEYYQEEMDHDVLFIGDCEVYENFTPQVLWEEYGINSYIRGSAQQLIWQSYYLLEDSLRYEKPEVVVFNVLSMKYNEPQNEAYNRMSIDGMKWSMSKINNIRASMCPEESFAEYVFPFLRYHSRWNDLTIDDFKYAFKAPERNAAYSGYYMRVDVKPAENVPEGAPLADYAFGENSYYYLEKMTQLCKENDIRLILIKAPSLYPYWYEEWDEQIEEFAKENELVYINFLDVTEEIGLDYSQDTYDAGLHLNLSGAEKLTRYFGNFLSQNCNLKDRRGEERLEAIWKEKSEDYYHHRDELLERESQ